MYNLDNMQWGIGEFIFAIIVLIIGLIKEHRSKKQAEKWAEEYRDALYTHDSKNEGLNKSKYKMPIDYDYDCDYNDDLDIDDEF